MTAATARFVRLTVTRLGRRDEGNFGFALAEMQLLASGVNVARDAKVLASGSVETGSWAKANLTDGVLETVKPEAAGALPATLLRKTLTLPGPVRRATAYASALGLYEFRVNGRRVGDQLLAPEWTSYRKRVTYQAYDVTSLLQPGENVLAAMLGEGWYAGRLMVVGRFPYGRQPRFLLQRTGTRRWRNPDLGQRRLMANHDGRCDPRQRPLRWGDL